ncbi:MAG: hypothetical protein MJZ87_08835 [Bacteroidales bacterium]|nr:hypothetical protein [Bacteroidales bacterium]
MRRKQTGPELKLFELDTLKYITPDNVKDSIHYVGIYPERMSPADVTFARKSGLLDSSLGRLILSKVALHFALGVIAFREYAFLMLSKQWVKTTNVGNEPTMYNEPLLVCILDEIQTRGRMPKSSFTQDMDEALASKYAPIILSNSDSLRYVRGLILASELVVEDGGDYIINPVATALVRDLILNRSHFVPPTDESEYESYWNTMEHGVFDVVNSTNKSLYSTFYPNLIK